MTEETFALINEANEFETDARGVHEVYTSVGLWRMAYEPGGKFRLIADIDMQGARWFPFAFHGKLDGNGHTISNFRIGDSLGGCEGFFTTLGKRGTICDLTFENVTVTCDKNAEKIGVICGKNDGAIIDCTVKNGVIKDGGEKMPFSRVIGIAAGKNCGSVSMVGRTSAAFLTKNAKVGLCGENAPDASVSGLWQDRSNATEFCSEEERTMRRKIVDKMFQMGTVQWTLGKDFSYDCSGKHPWCHHDFKANKVYYGMPYTHHFGSLERMKSCYKKVSDKKVKGLFDFAFASVDENDPDFPDFSSYLGNDCSGAVYWSWATAAADISFRLTGEMIPTAENCKAYGVVKIGNYACTLGNLTVSENDDLSRDPENRKKLIEAYTLMREGDALVHVCNTMVKFEDGKAKTGPGGHTILACADPVIIRDENGTVDIRRSHILTNEQGAANGRSDTTWALGGVWSFEQLSYGKSMKYKKHWQLYIPITNHALQNGHPDRAVLHTQNVTGPAQGIVSSNFRINSTEVFVLDKNGKILASDRSFTGIAGFAQKEMQYEGLDASGHYSADDYVCRSCFRSVDLKKHEKVLNGLKNGEYCYRIDVLLANGEIKSVSGQFVI